MKLIIAGGRNYQLTDADRAFLDRLRADQPGIIDEVLTGGATGADQGGIDWAISRLIPWGTFPADWEKHGRAAGPIRNRDMAVAARPDGIVVLFPGGKGTDSMWQEAQSAGLRIYRAEMQDYRKVRP